MLRDYDLNPAGDFRFHAPAAMKPNRLSFLWIRWICTNLEPVILRNPPIRAPLHPDALKRGIAMRKNPGSEFLDFSKKCRNPG